MKRGNVRMRKLFCSKIICITVTYLRDTMRGNNKSYKKGSHTASAPILLFFSLIHEPTYE